MPTDRSDAACTVAGVRKPSMKEPASFLPATSWSRLAKLAVDLTIPLTTRTAGNSAAAALPIAANRLNSS